VALIDAYPAPRATRKGGQSLPAASFTGGGGNPFTRVWSWRIRSGIQFTRTVLVSPAMRGPAIVDGMTITLIGATANGLNASWSLGYSEIPAVPQGDGPISYVPPGNFIFDTNRFDDSPTSITAPGGTDVGIDTGAQSSWPVRLRYPITLPTFYLWAVYDPNENQARSISGFVNVINNVSAEALASFL
jgi:hypothetical protein